MAFRLDYKSSTLNKGMDRLGAKMGAMVLMYAATKASEIRSYMKINRKWTDRTGMAKGTLDCRVSQPSERIIRLTLSHGVYYGIWLELAHEKKYAIIAPTIQVQGPRMVKDLNGLLSKIKL